jgi:hypothetical protein
MTDPCTENDGGAPSGDDGVTVEKTDCGVTITVQVRCGCGGESRHPLWDLVPPPDSTVVPTAPPSPDFPRELVIRDPAAEWTAFRLNMNGIWPWTSQYKWQSSFRVKRGWDSRELSVWTPAEQSRSLALYRGFGLAPLNGWNDLTASLSGAGGARRPIKVETFDVKIGAILAKPFVRGGSLPPGLTVKVPYEFTSGASAGQKHYAVVMPKKPVTSSSGTWAGYQAQGGRVELTPGAKSGTATVNIDAKVASGAEFAVFVVRSDKDIFDGAMDAEPVSPAYVVAAP